MEKNKGTTKEEQRNQERRAARVWCAGDPSFFVDIFYGKMRRCLRFLYLFCIMNSNDFDVSTIPGHKNA